MGIEATSLAPLVLAAMTMVGGYAQANHHQEPSSCIQIECENRDMESMRVVMTDLITGWKGLEDIYSRVLKKALSAGSIEEDAFGRIAELLKLTRGLEVTLKAATPPSGLAEQHMEFRRAVASTRSRLADIDSFYRQSRIVPHYVDTRIDLNGLKDLADFTTARLARIA